MMFQQMPSRPGQRPQREAHCKYEQRKIPTNGHKRACAAQEAAEGHPLPQSSGRGVAKENLRVPEHRQSLVLHSYSGVGSAEQRPLAV